MPEDRAIDVMLAVVVMGRITPGKGQHLAARLALVLAAGRLGT
jgi:hypothetical protein